MKVSRNYTSLDSGFFQSASEKIPILIREYGSQTLLDEEYEYTKVAGGSILCTYCKVFKCFNNL